MLCINRNSVDKIVFRVSKLNIFETYCIVITKNSDRVNGVWSLSSVLLSAFSESDESDDIN